MNEIGKVYNMLTVIKELQPKINYNGLKQRRVLCECVCGKTKKVLLNSLKTGNTKSCGCLRKELRIDKKLERLMNTNPMELNEKDSRYLKKHYQPRTGKD